MRRMTMNDERTTKLKYLRLAGLLTNWNGYLQLAAEKDFSHMQLLEHIIAEEYRIKRENARKNRLKRATIPEPYVIETYPFTKQANLNKKKVMAIYDAFDYIQKKRNIIFLGPTGCGKTGLATSFLTHAINQGYSGKYVTFAELIYQLFSSVGDHSEQKILKYYFSFDCLLVDEIGYIEIEPVQVGLFFTLMHKRHKQKATLITSNLGFADWCSFLKNDHLTAALIDRLTEVSHVINMKKCHSLRPNLEKKKDKK